MTKHRLPILRKPNEGRTIAVVGDVYRFLATGEETDGKYAMWEAIVPPGGGPPPHIHSREEESFYILEGEITFQVGDNRIVATAGTFANMPVGSLHSFKNATDKAARMIISVAPAGLEKLFFEVGVPLPEGSTEALPPTKEEIDKLLQIAPNYGIEIKLPGALKRSALHNLESELMSEAIERAVKSKYGAVAQSGLSSEHTGVRAVAEAFGYSPDELSSVPSEANMGLSCGNPTATANLRPGEVVVDLGCGGGLDVFLAAKKVGPAGRVVGIDMTEEMLELARSNAAKANSGLGVTNVEFHKSTIDKLPLADASVDCVISNCVINLAPDKSAVFREIVRVLKPGGRLAVSDIALKKPLPPEIGQDLMAYVGCVAGAIPIEKYREELIGAGFAAVEVIDTGADLNAYAKVENQNLCCSPAPSDLSVVESGCCSPPNSDDNLHAQLLELLSRYNVNEFAASVRVYAVKPSS